MRTRSSLPGFREVAHRKRVRRVGRTPFLKCARCGLFNDSRKTAWSIDGSGLTVTAEKTAPSTFTVYDNPVEQTQQSGCRFCGSLYWADSKPPSLPDDARFPATGWKRKRK